MGGDIAVVKAALPKRGNELLLENIPEELRQFPQWVLWKWKKLPEGRFTKPPFQPTGELAKSTDPNTWVTFDQVLRAYESGEFAGIGFVLSEKDPFCGFDLDKSRHRENGDIEPWAEKIVNFLNSYSEVSPSGRGLRILVKAKLPSTHRKKGVFEVYDDNRFLTLTGDRLCSLPAQVNFRQTETVALHNLIFKSNRKPEKTGKDDKLNMGLTDNELLQKVRAARNGEKFDRLWSGDYSGYQSQSEADLALVTMLSFWTGGNVERIDRLFRRSGLFRGKWDRASGSQTYGQRTIEKGLNFNKK